MNFPLKSLNRSLALKNIKIQIGIEGIYYGALNRYNLSIFKECPVNVGLRNMALVSFNMHMPVEGIGS